LIFLIYSAKLLELFVYITTVKKIIIFLGPPGSGKGTQAKKIVEKFSYGHISTGDLLRSLQKQADVAPDEQEAMEAMKHGGLVPDWLIYRLAFKAIESNLQAGRGVVLDGAVRNVAQAEEYQKFFIQQGAEGEVLTIEVAMPDEESFGRLAGRKMCATCGEIVPKAVAATGVCPKCDGNLVTRPDDSEDVVKHRIEVQGNAAIKPVRNYYQDLGVYISVDGMRPIEVVAGEIETILNK